jgi:hypothetical protein
MSHLVIWEHMEVCGAFLESVRPRGPAVIRCGKFGLTIWFNDDGRTQAVQLSISVGALTEQKSRSVIVRWAERRCLCRLSGLPVLWISGMKVVLPDSGSRPCLDGVWGALLEIGIQWLTVGEWLDREVFRNCRGY